MRRDGLLQSGEAEAAVQLTAAEVARPDLPDEIRPMLMMARDAALSGVVQTVGQRGSEIQCFDRRTAQCTEAHAGNVDHRGWTEGASPPAEPADDFGARQGKCRDGGTVAIAWFRCRQRERLVLDHEIVRGLLHLVVAPEAKVVVLQLRRGVDPASLRAAERPLFIVVRHDVLAQLRADRLEPIPEMPNDGEVPQDGVTPLDEVVRSDCRKHASDETENPHLWCYLPPPFGTPVPGGGERAVRPTSSPPQAAGRGGCLAASQPGGGATAANKAGHAGNRPPPAVLQCRARSGASMGVYGGARGRHTDGRRRVGGVLCVGWSMRT